VTTEQRFQFSAVDLKFLDQCLLVFWLHFLLSNALMDSLSAADLKLFIGGIIVVL
jgi:hypothetical protein